MVVNSDGSSWSSPVKAKTLTKDLQVCWKKPKQKKEGKKNKVHTQVSQWHADASLNYYPWMEKHRDIHWIFKCFVFYFCFLKVALKSYCITPSYAETWNSVVLNLRTVLYCSGVAHLSVSSNLPLKGALVHTHGQLKDDSKSVIMDQASSHLLCSCFPVCLGASPALGDSFFLKE